MLYICVYYFKIHCWLLYILYYVWQSSNNDVTVERLVTVAPDDCKTVDILYQPSSIANTSAELVAASSQVGTFMLVWDSIMYSCIMFCCSTTAVSTLFGISWMTKFYYCRPHWKWVFCKNIFHQNKPRNFSYLSWG